MYIESHTVTLTTDASGDCTAYSSNVTGRILAIRYKPGTLDTGADLTITADATGAAIITLTNAGTSNVSYYPRVQVHGPTGAALTYDGTRTINEPPFVSNERIKIVVAQGGNALTGTITFLVG